MKKESPTYILSIYDADKAILDDRNKLDEMYKKLLEETHLTPMTKLDIFIDNDCNQINRGMSANQLIKESGIYNHSFPERSWIRAIVSSCKQFNHIEVRNFLLRFFNSKAKQRESKLWNHDKDIIEINPLYKGSLIFDGYDIRFDNEGKKLEEYRR